MSLVSERRRNLLLVVAEVAISVEDGGHVSTSRGVGGLTETVERNRGDGAKALGDWALDGTRVGRTTKTSLRSADVSLDDAERDVVEGDHAGMGGTKLLEVLDLSLALLGVGIDVEVRRAAVLVVHVDHVARGAAIIGARVGAVGSLVDSSSRSKETNGAGAIDGALILGPVVGIGELELNTSPTNVLDDPSLLLGDEETRAAVRGLLHDRRVTELLNKSLTTLDGGIRQLSVLGGAVTRPATALDMLEHQEHTLDVAEVDEGIANVVSRLEVDAKVDEVVGAKADTIQKSLESHLEDSQYKRSIEQEEG